MELVFLCPAIKKAVGGVKVIYRQAALMNELLRPAGGCASVLHPNTWRFKVQWFESHVPLRRAHFKWRWVGKPSKSDIRGVFDPARDVLVVPELWVRKYGVQLLEAKVPYVIYVQNGYYINKGRPDDLDRAYRGAKCILTISEDASRCVAMAFPGVQERILRVHYSIDVGNFNPHRPKENLITYMPRKLADHSAKALFFLRNHLPPHWKIQPIDGLNESGVADLLSRSRIFMSFSHFEGCPLPPLEAALSGNRVVGYTGQGAREYWHADVFDEIESGDLVSLAQQVLRRVADWDANPTGTAPALQTLKKLADTYSAHQEEADMRALLQRLVD
jgi:hypothetical protein